jgi:hypothetical protein
LGKVLAKGQPITMVSRFLASYGTEHQRILVFVLPFSLGWMLCFNDVYQGFINQRLNQPKLSLRKQLGGAQVSIINCWYLFGGFQISNSW